MRRDLDRLTAHTFDVLVVGGGICGLIIACDAADRGLTVALIERDDFGSGASFNHLRTIHGGLRYLQAANIARARESIRERRALARIAPAALRPLPFVLPLTRSLTRGTLAMRLGFVADRLVSYDRNDGVAPALALLPGHVLGRRETLDRYPELARGRLTGAAVWHDYVALEADRLTIAWALAAANRGAVLANYVEGMAVTTEGRRVVALEAKDRLGGRTLSVAARITVNATGGALDRLLAPLGVTTRVPTIQAMNLVTCRTPSDVAFGALGATGRNFFMVPWRGRALFGTWESTTPRSADDPGIREEDLTSFIRDVNEAFPAMALTLRDVTLVHRGIVPAVPGPSGQLRARGDDVIRDHVRNEGIDGLVSVAVAKYTTARAVAERVTTLLFEKLARRPVPARTGTTTLPVSLGACDDDLRRGVRDEMVQTLEDVVIRRTPLGALGYPGDETAMRAASVVGAELGWDAARQRREVESLRRFYTI